MSVKAIEATTDAAWARLSSRQFAVALLAARGLSNKDIARQLTVAEQTVKQHMHQILRKLGLPSRYKLIISMKATNVDAAKITQGLSTPE